MDWKFEKVAGPVASPIEGLAWNGSALYFSETEKDNILRFDPKTGETTVARRYMNKPAGLAFSPKGEFFVCQQLSRRIIRLNPDGSATAMTYRFEGMPYHDSFHNMPKHITVDVLGRIWFSDPMHKLLAVGPPLPYSGKQSVLRLEQRPEHSWVLKRAVSDTTHPAGVAVSHDAKTLYVANKGSETSDLRAYSISEDGELGQYMTLLTFGSDYRGPHRGVDGICLDADGNIVACAGSSDAGAGPAIYVIAPSGRVLDFQAVPSARPIHCAFGGSDMATLFVSTQAGELFQVKDTGRRGKALRARTA